MSKDTIDNRLTWSIGRVREMADAADTQRARTEARAKLAATREYQALRAIASDYLSAAKACDDVGDNTSRTDPAKLRAIADRADNLLKQRGELTEKVRGTIEYGMLFAVAGAKYAEQTLTREFE